VRATLDLKMNRRKPRFFLVLVMLVMVASATGFYFFGRGMWVPVYYRLVGRRTVADVIAKYGPLAESRLGPLFSSQGMSYPPERIALVGMKKEKALELWALQGQQWKKVRTYPIVRASGKLGPKLSKGDYQVPEGIYQIVGLNPNSNYHLSIKLDYPNAFDREMAMREKRNDPGDDIFIHGKNVSIGCLAMGDEAIEDLFVLVSKVGVSNSTVVIAPQDLRKNPTVSAEGLPSWSSTLYDRLRAEMKKYL
jgi:hypothetical protein